MDAFPANDLMEKKTLYLFFCVFSLMISTTTEAAQIIPVKVGVVLDMDDRGEMTFNCISMALADFYATHDHYKTRLVLTNRDSRGDVVGAAAAALDLLKNVKVQAIIGPLFSTQASFLISLGDKAQVPVISFSATSPSLASLQSPYFIQATPDDSSQVEAIGAIIKAFGWREVVAVYEDSEFGKGMIPFLADALENLNVPIRCRSVISPLATDDHIVAELYKLMTMQTRVFVVHIMSNLASRLGSIVWPGGQSYPPKGWVIPTNGKKLRVGVPVKVGYTEFVHVTWNSDNSTKVEGYCIDVFDAVMAALPYGVQYEYIPFATPDHKGAGDYNDLVYQVHIGKFDAVAGDISIVRNRSEYVDFTLPYSESGVAMIVPIKDDKNRNAWAFLRPLTWELWLATFCSFIFIGCLIWILEHRINEDFRGPFWHQVGLIFWFAFSTMVFAQKERVINNLSRLVLMIWLLVALILTQSYTASLASRLTVQQLYPTVRDVNLLLKNREYVGYLEKSFVRELLKQMKFDESRLVEFTSQEQLDELLSKGSGNGGISAAFHEYPYTKLFLGKYCSKYMMVEPTYQANGHGFAFPKGSPLVADVSRAILSVKEGQNIVKIERKWMGEMNKCRDSDTLSSPRSLRLASFWGLFTIVGIVGVAAFVIYVLSFLRENWSVLKSSDPESTIRSKITELMQKFDNKDPSFHTFKNPKSSEIKDAGYCGDCMFRAAHSPYANNQQSPYNVSMEFGDTDGPPSLVFSSPATDTLNLQGDQKDPSREC